MSEYPKNTHLTIYDSDGVEIGTISSDEKYSLRGIKNDVKALLKKYNSIKHHFKKFNAYTEAVTYQFEELVKYLQLLDNIENDKIESLKKEE